MSHRNTILLSRPATIKHFASFIFSVNRKIINLALSDFIVIGETQK